MGFSAQNSQFQGQNDPGSPNQPRPNQSEPNQGQTGQYAGAGLFTGPGQFSHSSQFVSSGQPNTDIHTGTFARTQQSQIYTIDLVQVFHVILENILQIFLAAMVGALAIYFVSAYLVHPRYSSTTKIYVMANEEVAKGSVDTSTLQAGMLLTKDYEQIIKSRQVTDSVIANLDLNMTSIQLKNMMTVDIPDGTRVISISVSAPDPYQAADICSEIREVSIKRIREVMDMKSIEVVEDANIPRSPYYPRSSRYALLGAIIGALLAIAIVVSSSLLNNTIRTSEDIERYLGLSTLGSIPYDEMEDDKRKSRWSRKHDHL